MPRFVRIMRSRIKMKKKSKNILSRPQILHQTIKMSLFIVSFSVIIVINKQTRT